MMESGRVDGHHRKQAHWFMSPHYILDEVDIDDGTNMLKTKLECGKKILSPPQHIYRLYLLVRIKRGAKL